MSILTDQLQISIAEEGRLLGNAVVSSSPDSGWLQASLHLEPGHERTTSGELVDAVLELTDARPGTTVQVSFALGEADILERMRQRCHQVEVRAAGASCMFSGIVSSSV